MSVAGVGGGAAAAAATAVAMTDSMQSPSGPASAGGTKNPATAPPLGSKESPAKKQRIHYWERNIDLRIRLYKPLPPPRLPDCLAEISLLAYLARIPSCFGDLPRWLMTKDVVALKCVSKGCKKLVLTSWPQIALDPFVEACHIKVEEIVKNPDKLKQVKEFLHAFAILKKYKPHVLATFDQDLINASSEKPDNDSTGVARMSDK